ncbi:MAG: PepSY domain-containing protein, partial [Agathobacter sp.]|nr:PepSY domain-containing protein [Agathobacter sp.]
ILVSVHSRNSEKAAALKETISTDITAILDGSNIEASVIVQEFERDEEVDKIAEENKISHGKAKLIARIIKAGLTDAEGYEYTYERLAALTVNELRVLWNCKDVELDDVQSSGTASETKYLGKAKALELVYVHAAVVVENVVDVEVDMDYEDGIMVYEIEFYSDGYEYEYKLNAITGEILVSEKSEEPAEEDDGAQIPDEEVTPEEGQNPDEETTPDEVKPGEQESPDKTPGKEDNKDHPSRIGRGNAKKIAMNHAGFTRDKLRDLECDFDEEDGKYVYKVEFEVDGVEYTYVIDVNSGEILHVETEAEDDEDDDNRKPGNNNSGNEKPGQGQKPGQEQQPADKPQIIQKEKVLAMVLKDASVTMKEVKDLKCELEEEDGAYCYEIEFEVNDTEYEYKVDALTGEILEVNKETEDADEADAV